MPLSHLRASVVDRTRYFDDDDGDHRQGDSRATYFRRSGDRKDSMLFMWVCDKEKSVDTRKCSVDAVRYGDAVRNAAVTDLTSTWLSSADRDSDVKRDTKFRSEGQVKVRLQVVSSLQFLIAR